MVEIKPDPLQEMIADAVRTYPDECCGFLFGKDIGPDTRIIQKILSVNNSKEGDKRRRFLITPKDYLYAEMFAEKNGLALLGIYHSHPEHPAIPSEHDRVAAQPFFSYLILSVMNKQYDHINSWQLNDELQFEEELIKL